MKEKGEGKGKMKKGRGKGKQIGAREKGKGGRMKGKNHTQKNQHQECFKEISGGTLELTILELKNAPLYY